VPEPDEPFVVVRDEVVCASLSSDGEVGDDAATPSASTPMATRMPDSTAGSVTPPPTTLEVVAIV
jgi:hypothetical protein